MNMDNIDETETLIEVTKKKLEIKNKAIRRALNIKTQQSDTNPQEMCLPVVMCYPCDMKLTEDAKKQISGSNEMHFAEIKVINEKGKKTKFTLPDTASEMKKFKKSTTVLTNYLKGACENAKEFQLLFKECEFKRKSGDQEHLFKLVSSDMENFLNDYFAARQEALITIPDFDRIKVTKLFELGVPQKKKLNEKDPVDDFPKLKVNEKDPADDFPKGKLNVKDTADEFPKGTLNMKDPVDDIPKGKLNEKDPADDFPKGKLNVKDTADEFPKGTLNMKDPVDDIPKGKLNEKDPADDFPKGTLNMKDPVDDISKGTLNVKGTVDDFPKGTLNVKGTVDDFPMGKLNEKDPADDFPKGKLNVKDTADEFPKGTLNMKDPVDDIPKGKLNEKDPADDFPKGTLNMKDPVDDIPKGTLNVKGTVDDFPKGTLNVKGTVDDFPMGKLNEKDPADDFPKGKLNVKDPVDDFPKGKLNEKDPVDEFPKGKLNEKDPADDFPKGTLNMKDPVDDIPKGTLNVKGTVDDFPKGTLNVKGTVDDFPMGKLNEKDPADDFPKGKLNVKDPVDDFPKGKLNEKDPVDEFPKGKLNENDCYYPMDPWDSSVFSYIGEVEKFWPQFGLWEKDPKGLLMHGYSQNELKPLLINDQFFSFEFDWLYFSSQSVTLVEVTVCEDPGKNINVESRVKEKVKQLLRHICTVKLIVWYILKHFNPESQLLSATEFNKFIGRCFKFVLYLVNVEIEANVKNLSKQLLNLTQIANFNGENFLLAGSTSNLYKLDLANKTLQESSLTSSCEVSDEDIELLTWISATFAMGYFVQKGSTILDNHRQCPGPFAERYIERQRTFLEKFTHYSNTKASFLKELNVILSPQQFGILFANPKVVFLTGESGAGKTELLLAKALQSASDNSIDKIFFCMPSQYVSSGGKPQLRKLWNYVEGFREKHKRRFNDKFEIISYETLISRSFLQKAPVWWNRTVLLIDEFHYRYDSTFGISSEEFKNACLQIGPYLKNFWFATITLKWYDGMRKIIDTFVPLEFLSTKPLNVQYRSATHIGQFCTNLVHVDRDGRFSGTKVPGVFISKSQDKVTLKKFKKDNQECKDQNFFDSTNPGRDLSSNYEGNRWVVCCCEKRNKETWVARLEKYIESQRKKELTVIQPEGFVFVFEEGPSGVHLSGAEVHSVILFIDGPLEEMYRSSPEEKDKIDNIFLLVCARAQFELVVYVREDLAHLWGTFQKCMKADMERKKKFSNEAITQPPESSSTRDDDGPNKEETTRSENSGNVSPQLPGNEAPNNESVLENENLTQGTQG